MVVGLVFANENHNVLAEFPVAAQDMVFIVLVLVNGPFWHSVWC